MSRRHPNILVTGTPGTGKTSLCQSIAANPEAALKHYEVSVYAKEKGYTDGEDEFGAAYLDEDPLLDDFEKIVADGGCLVEFHSPALFPERWFDLVVVLTTDNSLLYSRLERRGYAPGKITHNVGLEIMQSVLTETYDSYKPNLIQVLVNDTIEHMQQHEETIIAWARNYRLMRP